MENPGVDHTGGSPGLGLRLLGPVGISRGGQPVALPRSRKVRALLAFLALEQRPVPRSRLCDLLWDVPNDPRGELRWCLSKLRSVLDEPSSATGGERRRVLAVDRDSVLLELSDCHVDALALERAVANGLGQLSPAALAELAQQPGGELLEGVHVDGNLELSSWLAARRAHYREQQVALLTELVARAARGSAERLLHLRSWLRLLPFDARAHEQLLGELLAAGRAQEAEAHAAAALRAFEQEGLDWAPLRAAWQALRAATAPVSAVAAPLVVSVAAPVLATPLVATAIVSAPAAQVEARPRRRASIAVMPFVEAGAPSGAVDARVADGLTEDVITRLAKLRMLFVIARGTVFALRQRGVGPEEAGRILNVEYVASGSLRREGARISLLVELAETDSARIIWADELSVSAEQTFAALDSIVDRIVAALAEEIESAEVQRALLRPPSSLDAWEAYHRGLWHMYRFNGPDNAEAERFFRSALALDPTFSRAHAGLSFTHFQNAFLSLTADRERQVAQALATAADSLAADDRDPAAHWALGRALWLNREHETALVELERCVELSPNFALGYYTLGFVQSQAGDARSAIAAIDTARQLSPFDPLLFGMLASRAVAHLRLGQWEEAALWSAKAAVRPNAHEHILAIAAHCAALAERRDQARELWARLQARAPGYGVADLLRSFRFDAEAEQLFRRAARQLGWGE